MQVTIYISYFIHGPPLCKRGGFAPGAINLGAHGGRTGASTRDGKVDPACASPPLGEGTACPDLPSQAFPQWYLRPR